MSAAAAAKSLQLCPTLCGPIDGSPPGSPIPGILQARILEWVAVSFSNAWKWKVKGKSLSRVRLLATPWPTAYQAPPSMGFSRQEYWRGVPLPSPASMSNTLNNWLHPAFASTPGRGWPISFSSLTSQEVSRGTHFVLRFRGLFSSIQEESPWCRPISQASSKDFLFFCSDPNWEQEAHPKPIQKINQPNKMCLLTIDVVIQNG